MCLPPMEGKHMAQTRRTKARRTEVVGDRGTNRVRIVRHHRTGALCLDWSERDPDGTRRRRRKVLAGATLLEAKAEAERKAIELRQAEGRAPKASLTVRMLFDRYVDEVTPSKGKSGQALDSAARRLFDLWWGERAIDSLRDYDFKLYTDARRSGRLRLPRGAARVRDCQIGHELKAFRAACNWALRQPTPGGGFLLDRNPLTGYRLPKEQEPNRPVLTDEEYLKLRPVAWEISPEFGAVLELVHETGHRLASVLQLRSDDVDIPGRRIRWRAAADKTRREHSTVMTPAAIDAIARLRRELPRIGAGYLFPSPDVPGAHRSRESAYKWWREGERRAELPRSKGRAWHSLRRKFATELVDVPLAVLQQLGGWSTARTIVECYQHPDEKAQAGALASRRRHGSG